MAQQRRRLVEHPRRLGPGQQFPRLAGAFAFASAQWRPCAVRVPVVSTRRGRSIRRSGRRRSASRRATRHYQPKLSGLPRFRPYKRQCRIILFCQDRKLRRLPLHLEASRTSNAGRPTPSRGILLQVLAIESAGQAQLHSCKPARVSRVSGSGSGPARGDARALMVRPAGSVPTRASVHRRGR